MSSTKRKTEFLGISHGSATNKLRKMIMFQMLVRLNEDNCYRCKQKIISEADLSMEHKKPWEGRSVDLFWNLDNIAFSHRACNLPHNRSGGAVRKNNGPDGTAWCGSCESHKPKQEFHKNRNAWHGVNWICAKCFNERRKRYPSRRSV